MNFRTSILLLSLLGALPAYADQASIAIPEGSTAFKSAFGTTTSTFDDVLHYALNPALKTLASNFGGTSCASITVPTQNQWCVDINSRTVKMYSPNGSGVYAWNTALVINSDGSLSPSNLVAGAVSSVAGRSGSVLLTSSDLTDTTTLGRGLVGASNAAAAKALLSITASDVKNLAPSAVTDTTNAGNIGTGTLPSARLPAIVTQPISITPPDPAWSTLSGLYSGSSVNVGGLPTSAMDAHAAGAVGMPMGFIGAIDVPSSFTGTFVSAGVAGYGRNANPAGSAVGLFGGSMANAAGGNNWGLNTICTNTPTIVPATQTGFNGVTCYGAELDVNIFKLPGGGTPTGTVRGLAMFGGSEVKPSGGAYGIEVGSFSQSAPNSVFWDAAIVIDEAPNTDAIVIGANASGTNNVGSQSLTFNSRSSGGTNNQSKIYTDADGSLILSPRVGVGAFVSLQDGLGNVGLTIDSWGAKLTSSTVAGLPSCNGSTHGDLRRVTDATAPTYNGALTGGGTVEVPVFCNGTAWTAH